MDDHSEPEFSMGSLLHAAAVWATYWPHTLATATLACTLLAVHLRKAIMTVVFEALQRTHAGVGGIFHTGLFQPTPHELHITKPLPVLSGYVPPELDGYYMRTGPNPQFDPIGGYHLFDGEAMIHCVQFKAGAATAYCNHWVRCERFENERKAGHNIYMRIGDMRGLQGLIMIIMMYLFPFNLPGRKYKGKEQAAMGNTALACHRGRLLALNEAGYPIEVKVSSEGSMSTGEVVRYEGRLDHPFTAHPKIDPATNEMCFFGYEIGLTSPVTYSTVSADGRLSKGTAIDVQRAQLMHDFGITPNYAVFIDQNLVMTPQALMKPCKKLPFAIENGFNGRLGLLRRSAPEAGVAWFDLGRAVGWAAHVGNAWEDADGSRVHIVITQYDQLDLSAEEFTLGGGIARLVRLSLHVASGHVEWTQLVTDPHLHFEFPVISPRAVGQPCRYMYVVYSDIRYSHTRVAFDGIARIDMHAAAGEGLQGCTAFPDGFKGGELSFVPRKLAAAAVGPRNHEDGYIVGFITNEETQQSRLAVYDTFFTFEDPSFPDPPGPAMIQMPHRIPLGFHGLFVRQDELGAKHA